MSNLKLAEQSQEQLDDAVAHYKELNAKIAFLASQIKPYKEIIEAAATQSPDGQIITEKYKINLVLCQRENFDKKAAFKALGDKVLSPFVSTVAYTQLRVT